MRRFLSSRYIKPLLLGTAAFSAGCIATGSYFLINSDSCSPLGKPTVVQMATALKPPLDTTDFGHGPVFSPAGPLPDPVAQVGLPGAEPIKILPGFLCLYDRRTRTPRWTLELITNHQITGNATDAVDR